ncbi:MAG TPA: chorismate mutase [Dehalococcoidia bacterium]|nr:chorismate mutase [Dehalococcoidia bacterium]
MQCRGIRGAITVEANTREDILEATKELLLEMVEANGIKVEDIASVMFTLTADLDAEFPAMAARQLGWLNTALLCSREVDVPGSLGRCLRIMMLCNTEKSTDEIVHVYMKGAANLRPDVSEIQNR